jgi:hypothetical protein
MQTSKQCRDKGYIHKHISIRRKSSKTLPPWASELGSTRRFVGPEGRTKIRMVLRVSQGGIHDQLPLSELPSIQPRRQEQPVWVSQLLSGPNLLGLEVTRNSGFFCRSRPRSFFWTNYVALRKKSLQPAKLRSHVHR